MKGGFRTDFLSIAVKRMSKSDLVGLKTASGSSKVWHKLTQIVNENNFEK